MVEKTAETMGRWRADLKVYVMAGKWDLNLAAMTVKCLALCSVAWRVESLVRLQAEMTADQRAKTSAAAMVRMKVDSTVGVTEKPKAGHLVLQKAGK